MSNKIIKRAVLGIVVVGAVAAVGAWYVMAGKTLTGAQALIDKVNTTQHSNGSSFKITYDSLTRTMFPTVGVRLVNPAIEVNSPGIPAKQPEDTTAAVVPPQPFHVAWKHTGTVDIITDCLSHEYRLVNDGSGAGSLTSGSDNIAISSAPAHSEMTLTAKNGAAFTQWQSLNFSDQAAVKHALGQIGGAHLAAGPMKVTNTATGAIITTLDESKFDLTNRSDDTRINFDTALLSKGSEVTQEYVDLITRVLTIMHLPTEAITTMPMSVARAGKQDIDIAANVNLPTTPQGQPMPSGDVHVTKFSIKNNFYTLQAPLDVVLHEDAAHRHAAIKLNWSLEITPAGGQETQAMIDQAMRLTSGNAGGVDQAQLNQKIIAALPNVSTLGPITLVLDVDATTPKPGAPAVDGKPADTKESLTLRQFSFEHKRWGIDAKGEALSDDPARGGTINGTLTCKQCTTLTQDFFATARGVQDVMALMQPGSVPFPLSDAMLVQLNTTLAAIGKPGAATGDIDFVVTTPTVGDVRVNDKPAGQVMPQLMMVFMQPAPAAPAAAAPVPARPQSSPGRPAI